MENFAVHEAKSNKCTHIDWIYFLKKKTNKIIKYPVLERMEMECEMTIMWSTCEFLSLLIAGHLVWFSLAFLPVLSYKYTGRQHCYFRQNTVCNIGDKGNEFYV